MTAPSGGDQPRRGREAAEGARDADDVVVRMSGPDDVGLAAAAAALIEEASRTHDVARRDPDWLADKIRTGHAALALRGADLVGFGYWSEWEGGRFLSHSGLVVAPVARGRHLGRRLKTALFDSSRARFPRATLMSLSTSPEVQAMNRTLGFRDVPLDALTSDPAFWEGCRACRNFDSVRARGLRCCCEAMILQPDDAPPGATPDVAPSADDPHPDRRSPPEPAP